MSSESKQSVITPHDTRYLFVLPFSTDPGLARRFLARDNDMVGNIRFGKILETLDKVAENTALAYVHRFYPGARVVTAAVDSIVLRNPADTRHDLVFSAQINHVGKSSMEVGIRIECLGEGSSHLASCYFTMVARSTDGGEAKSLPLPPLQYLEEIDKKRYQKAEHRRQAYRDGLAKAEEMPWHVNRINFNQPVMMGDQLKFTARVVYTGKTTITVQSDIERFSRSDGNKSLSNSCLFTFRNVSSDMSPKPVPFIYPVTY